MFRAHVSCQWLSLGCHHKQIDKGIPPHQGVAVMDGVRVTAAVKDHGQNRCRNQDELVSRYNMHAIAAYAVNMTCEERRCL